ncbi:MAG: 3-dehydroquinate dehydratase [Solirubrobacteraceae bacterium]|nr:3-dehydroquinate dehydratase [Solirubrobacteraceae bacterium]
MSAPRVVVLHGVNLDQLGVRDPAVYGSQTLSDLEAAISGFARDLGIRSVVFEQTNFEGEYVELLHKTRDTADALILNPGAWTHYSWAIRDALEIAGHPAVEVHLSDVQAREEWRRHSVISELCIGTISGKGADGYREALELLLHHEAPAAG